MRIAVIGMGNVLMADDAVGPYVIQVLKAQYEFDPFVEILDVGTPGLDLSPYMADLDTLILVDTVNSDAPGGTLRLYDKPALLRTKQQPRFSPHDPGLGECLTLLEIAGHAPAEVVLIGIVPQDCIFRAGLSAAVQSAIGSAVREVIGQLKSRGITVVPRVGVCQPDIWWEHVPCHTRQSD